jgi:imidazolonepropionase-like amidohydrolase
MLQHGTWLVADIYNGDYTEEIGTRDGWPEEILRKNRETTDIQRQNFAKAVKAGVRIAFGTMPVSTRTATMPSSSPTWSNTA